MACLGVRQPRRRVGHPQGHSNAIVHKANEDWIVSIDELGVVLSILLAMEVEALVTLRRSLPILLLVLGRDWMIFLLTSAPDVPLGGAHSGSKKRLT